MPTARLPLAALFLMAAACSTDGTTNPEPVVASVAVTLTQAAAQAGTAVGATAVLRDADGQVIVRPVEWRSSNPFVATVSEIGTVTAVGVGSASITATSEGRSGAAALTVTTAVAQVALTGVARVKVGDAYQFTVEQRGHDGAITQRPVYWSVPNDLLADNPSRGMITQAGVMTPLVPGTIIVRAMIDNVAHELVVTGYDWSGEYTVTSAAIRLPADAPVLNALGQQVFPEIALTCNAATAELLLDTGLSIVPSGSVSIAIDGGAPVTQTWHARSNANWDGFNGLVYPGGTGADNLVPKLGRARHVAIAFADVNGVVRTAQFRITGLALAVYAPMLGVSTQTSCLN